MSNSAFTPTFAQNLQDASATQKGLVNTTTQTFAGKKTFDGGAVIKGDTSGSAVAAGYIGEIIPFIERSATVGTANTYGSNNTPLATLSAGVWIVYAYMSFGTANNASVIGGFVATNSSSDSTGFIARGFSAFPNITNATTAAVVSLVPVSAVLVASPATQALYAKGYIEDITGSVTIGGFAVRVA